MSGYTDADLVILVPMLGRPQHVAPLLATIEATVPNAEVLFLCSPQDWAVLDEIKSADRSYVEVPYYPVGDYARKINRGVFATTHSLIFLGASDLAFYPNWFEHAIEHLHPGIGVVGTNDLGNARVIAGTHSTHSLVTREYAALGTIDAREKLLHEGYHHEFVDDEFIETARFRQAFEMAPESIVEHLHPNWGKATTDPLYDQQRRRMAYGHRLYNHRRRLWQ
jgi:hypothetical protein